MYEIVQTNQEEIRERYPKTMRRVGGYCLDELIRDEPWNPGRIFLGSEGTLGIILEAKLNLVPLPKFKSLAVIHFNDRMEAIRPVGLMLEYKPAAVEILSKLLLDYSRKNLETQSKCDFIKGDPQSIQMVEFYGDTEEDVLERPKHMIEALRAGGFGYAYDIYLEGETYRNVWAIRERGLGLLLGEPSEEKGIEFVEDAAIPIPDLAEYIDKVLKICTDLGVDVTYYAHASVGVIHVRPILNLRTQQGIDHMKQIAHEAFKLVMHYKGSWSSEHGDGLIRSSFLKEFYGDNINNLFGEIKQLFDPAGLLNPGKIVDPPPMDKDLRLGAGYKDLPLQATYHYRDQIDFHTAVHQCSGLGACRKIAGGTMCPSYMVTRDEADSTRGRANALRMAMSGQFSASGLADPALKETLDLCISCKACKAECPSSVDMARLKGEVLQIQYKANGTSFRDRVIRDSPAASGKMSGFFAPLINAVQESVVFRSVMEKTAGFSRKRMLPGYATKSFEHWYKTHYSPIDSPDVVLFADTYLNYHEPQIGVAAVRLINHLGHNVVLATGCCQRPRISHGFLEKAKAAGQHVAMMLDEYIRNGIAVLVCEPSCASALTDDLPDLLDDADLAKRMHDGIQPIEKWVSAHLDTAAPGTLEVVSPHVILHGHCHQKALFGTGDVHKILKAAGASIEEPDSGCCGMAGSFGYEKEHYDISQKMFERVLGPELRKHSDAVIVASGFSCRHQIAHFAQRKAMHWVEALHIVEEVRG
jgi:Fe-S oxidoreductase